MKPKHFSIKSLCELVGYDPNNGNLIWLPRGRHWFGSEESFQLWNKHYSWEAAFTTINSAGYPFGKLFRINYLAIEVAFARWHKHWPSNPIHIDGDKTNNRIRNIRQLSNEEASIAKSIYNQTNSSGVTGVTWNNSSQSWLAQIKVAGYNIYLGSSKDKDKAIALRRAAEEKYYK